MIYVHHHHRSLSYWVEVGPNDESIIVWYACTFPTGPVRTGWRPQGPKRHTHGVKDEIISLEVLGVVRSESIASWCWPWCVTSPEQCHTATRIGGRNFYVPQVPGNAAFCVFDG